MGIALEDASRMGLSLPGLELAIQFYEIAQRKGLENKGTQALLQVLRSTNQNDLIGDKEGFKISLK